METYFFEDRKIIDGVDQIIEKLIAASLLNHEQLPSRDLEELSFIVSKITHLFTTTTNLPPEAMIEGVRQLIEERLPEKKIMEHFPNFYDNLTSIFDLTLQKLRSDYDSLTPAKAVFAYSKTDGAESLGILVDTSTVDYSAIDASAVDSSAVDTPAIDTLAVDNLLPDTPMAEVQARDIPHPEIPVEEIFRPETPVAAATEVSREASLSEGTEVSSAKLKRIRNSKTPENATVVQHLLTKFYPGSTIYWNISLASHTFFAQVDNLLVYLASDHEETDKIVNKLSKEGWKILCCSVSDLRFPKRLERQIRAILRESKY